MEREVKFTMPPLGQEVVGMDVPIAKQEEKACEYVLEDGTVFRIKASLQSAVRVKGVWDKDGNPRYALKTSMSINIVYTPESLKNKGARDGHTN
jgi:hypothetical protein